MTSALLLAAAALAGVMTLPSPVAAIRQPATSIALGSSAFDADDDDRRRGRGRNDEDSDSDSDSDSDDSDRKGRSRRTTSCVDRNRDGFCDGDIRRDRRPSSLPDMIGAIIFGRGQQSPEARRWLGDTPLRVASTDANRDGRPELAMFRDRGGQIVQVWRDRNRDGRADLVEIYQRGKLARVIR